MNLLTTYAFQTLNLQKILLEVLTENSPALKLYLKLGFEIEGTLKKQFYIDGNYKDVYILSLFKKN